MNGTEFAFYEYFFGVASCGSITNAAQQLHVSQPAVSKAMANLESQLQCKLFVRSAKGVTLTEQGQILFETVKQSYFLLNTAKAKILELSKESQPQVGIGAGNDITTFVVLPWLNSFKKKHPSTIVKILEARSLDILKAICRDEVDFGLSHTRVSDPTLEFHCLFELDYCFVVGEELRFLAGPPTISIHDLIRFPMILFPPQSVKRQHINNFFRSHGISISPMYEAGNANLLMQLAESNMGVALVPRGFAASRLGEKKLFEVKLEEKIPRDQVWLTWKKNKELSHAAANLLSHFRELGNTLR